MVVSHNGKNGSLTPVIVFCVKKGIFGVGDSDKIREKHEEKHFRCY